MSLQRKNLGAQHAVPFSMRRALKWLVCATTLTGCMASVGESGNYGDQLPIGAGGSSGSGGPGGSGGLPVGGSGGDVHDECEGTPPLRGVARFSRLQPSLYLQSMAELLELPLADDGALDNQSSIIPSTIELEQYADLAKGWVAANAHERFLDSSCPATGAFNASCATKFIERFGRRAFRRPVSTQESTKLMAVYTQIKDDTRFSPRASFRMAIGAVARVVLQSPQTIYSLKRGTPEPSMGSNVRRLSGYERAEQLAFSLWGSAPDVELLDAAANGSLDAPAGMRVQAQRLLNHARGRASVRRYASWWLRLDGMENTLKTDAIATPTLVQAMIDESQSLMETAFFEKNQFSELFTSTKGKLTPELARLYNVSMTGTSAQTVDLPPERQGILNRGAFLFREARPDVPSPILRGVFLYRHTLCNPLGEPPAGAAETEPTTANAPRTVREMTDQMTASSDCAGCHSLINPLGHALGSFDAIGRRSMEERVMFNGTMHTLPIDTKANVLAYGINAQVTGPTDLATRLSTSARAQECVVDNLFTQTYAHHPNKNERCGIKGATERFQATGDLQAVLLDVVTSEATQFVEESQQ